MEYPHQVDHDSATNADNPSNFGYHHGPIPNPNEGWLPLRQRLAHQNGTVPPTITAADHAEAPPNPPLLLSTLNGLVCDIVTEGDLMCGAQFTRQTSLRRHIRWNHPGCILPPTGTPISTLERARGERALKLLIRSGGWRNALYARDPGTGRKDGLLYQYASEMEHIAKEDSAFAEKYGTQFHREVSKSTAQKTSRSGSKRSRDTSEEVETDAGYMSTTGNSEIKREESPGAAEEAPASETDSEYMSATEYPEIDREQSPNAAEDPPATTPRMPCIFILTRKRQKR